MKKNFILLSAGVMLLASGCSNDITEPDINPGNMSDGNARYITVAISGLPEANSRGDENSDYESGSEAENTVKSVRFYFFDDNGAAANVKRCSDGSYLNYFDWSAKEDPEIDKNEGANAPNIEKTIKATLVINTKEGDHLPTRIAAIVNPTTQLGDESRDLASLRKVISDYKSSIANYGFTMSTSVYLGLNKTEVTSTEIPESSIQDTPQGALLQPVVVYVERVIAKVRVKVDATSFEGRIKTIGGNTAIALVDDKNNPIKADDKQVYAKFSNWNLTGTTSKSWLNKHINPAWDGITDFDWTWNYPTFFRSYWAWNCPGAGRNYFSYNQLIGETGQKFGTTASSLYCSENAATNTNFDNGVGDQYPTCGILCAVLCYENGNPVEFYKFLGETHIGEDNLITAMLSSIQSRKQLYSYKEVGGKKVFTEISKEDIELETAYAANKATLDNATKGRYHSYLTLSKVGSGKKWFASDREDQDVNKDFLKEADVIKFIQETTGAVNIWKEGMTYYYFPIEHLGKMGEDGKNYGKNGVVRNHIYDSTITELYGLGTPVYNPDETIYPEKPKDNDSYIAAKINILSWRLVNNNVKLEWPK